MITGKIIALISQTFVDKVKSLLFNMLSRLVIAFLPRSKHLLISWLQSPSEVILVMVHSLNLCLYVKRLISLSILSELLARLNNLDCRFFFLSIL